MSSLAANHWICCCLFWTRDGSPSFISRQLFYMALSPILPLSLVFTHGVSAHSGLSRIEHSLRRWSMICAFRAHLPFAVRDLRRFSFSSGSLNVRLVTAAPFWNRRCSSLESPPLIVEFTASNHEIRCCFVCSFITARRFQIICGHHWESRLRCP